MKKILLSLFVILTFSFYVIYKKNGDEENIAVVAPQPQQTSSPNASSDNSTEKYNDGTFTGDVTDAYYGNVQVSVKISNGKVSDVTFLDYPQDRQTSIEINTQAMPYLKQEAIAAQSDNVDIVSGATQTSGAFIKSLQTALDKAKV